MTDFGPDRDGSQSPRSKRMHRSSSAPIPESDLGADPSNDAFIERSSWPEAKEYLQQANLLQGNGALLDTGEKLFRRILSKPIPTDLEAMLSLTRHLIDTASANHRVHYWRGVSYSCLRRFAQATEALETANAMSQGAYSAELDRARSDSKA
jgi:tetratricopeptide (TPR) repeat protein